MIECSCQVLTTRDFNDAIAAHAADIEAAGSIKRAVGVVYNGARERKDHTAHKACTTCLPSLAQRIQEAGFYTNEKFPARKVHASELPPHSCASACIAACHTLAAG